MADLKRDALQKAKDGLSPHPEIIAIQQKFSFPVACLVFAVIGLALGLTVARESKLAAFVVGTLIIFAYYIVMFLSESLTKGHYLNMYLSRWVPNILLGAFGIAALIWRARFIEGRLPFKISALAARLMERVGRHDPVRRARAATSGAAAGSNRRRSAGSSRPPVLVIRIPRLRLPEPGTAGSLHQPDLHPDRRAVLPGAARPLPHLHVPGPVRQDLQGAGNHGRGGPAARCTSRRSSCTT